jgi:hypothetical protein
MAQENENCHLKFKEIYISAARWPGLDPRSGHL